MFLWRFEPGTDCPRTSLRNKSVLPGRRFLPENRRNRTQYGNAEAVAQLFDVSVISSRGLPRTLSASAAACFWTLFPSQEPDGAFSEAYGQCAMAMGNSLAQVWRNPTGFRVGRLSDGKRRAPVLRYSRQNGSNGSDRNNWSG